MSYCPNPECLHKIKTGSPAEFVEGITHCSDCGTPLSTDAPLVEVKKGFVLSDFQKRVLFTISMILLYRVSMHVPVSGINIKAFTEFFEANAGFVTGKFLPYSILALGIMPYVSSYMIVEICALFIPPLKAWRHSGYPGRRKLKKTAMILTIFIAFMQGYSIAKGLESMNSYTLVLEPGIVFRFLMAFTLIAGSFFTLWIAEMITKKGIGHGISILIVAGIIPLYFPKLKIIYQEYSPLCSVMVLVLVAGLFVLVFFVEKGFRSIDVRFNDGMTATLLLKITTAGTIPIIFVSTLVFLPAQFASVSSIPWLQSIANSLVPGSIIYIILYGIVLFFIYFFLTSLFYKPGKIESYFNERNATLTVPDGKVAEKYVDKSLESLAFLGFIYLYSIIVLTQIMTKLSALSFVIGGVVFIKAIAVLLDVREDYLARKFSGELVKVDETHDIPEAGFIKSILESNGINCYLRGYYHRALLYFFGPYIEVSVLVPQEKSDEANEILDKYVRRESM